MLRPAIVLVMMAGAAHGAPGVDFSHEACGTPCVVNVNHGGNIDAFLDATHRLVSEGRSLVINGPCDSACSLAAAIARPHVCITARATFGLHKGTVSQGGVALSRFDMTAMYPRDIAHWIHRKGGLPGVDVHDRRLLIMQNRDARRFFRVCRLDRT